MPLDEVFVNGALDAHRLVGTIMKLQDRRIVLSFSSLAVDNAGRDDDIIAVARAVAGEVNVFFRRILACSQFNVRYCWDLRAIAAVGVRNLHRQAGAVDDVCVTAVARVVVRAPTRFIVLAFLPVVLPREDGVVGVNALHTGCLAGRSVLYRVWNVRLGPIVAAILRGRTILAILLAGVGRFPAFFRIRDQEGFGHCIFTVLRYTFHREGVVRPINYGVGRVGVVTFARFFMAFVAQMGDHF